MRQALHIFQKDVRYLWRELCLLLLTAAILAWAESHSPGSFMAEILWTLAAAFTIARVVHAEAIPGHNQFWTTRPYRWKSLLAAKILFVLLFVNLPLLLGQAYIVQAAAFPLAPNLAGLLWSQVLMLLCLLLPITALAAMTAGIAPFFLSAFVLLTISFIGASGMLSIWRIRLPFRTPAAVPGSVDWVRLFLAIAIVACISAVVIYLLYRTRQVNIGRLCAVSGAVAAAAVYFYTTPLAALTVQSRFSRQPFDGASLKLTLDPPHRGPFPHRIPNPGRNTGTQVEMVMPIAIAGVADNVELQADALSVTLQSRDGKTWSSGFAGVNQQRSDAGAMVIDAYLFVDRAFFQEESSQPATVRASLYLTAFGNPTRRTIPIQNEAVDAVAGLRCGEGMLAQLSCRSVFRWPSSRVYAQFDRSGMELFTPFTSYSPFPATMGFNPIEQHWVATPATATDATITSKEPLTHFRRDVEFKGVLLTDFTRAR